MGSERFVAAAVQAEPVWLDLDGCVDKAVSLIAKAAEAGAALVAFPEVWIPGYPAWIWVGSPIWGAQFVPRYYENSVVVGDRSFERLRQAAADFSAAVVMGASERSAGSLYMAQFLFDATGEVVGTRRKLKPTGVQRAVFGEGDGSDLLVAEVCGVGRLGTLNCWEHLQPLTKYALYSMHEQVHVAAWPNLADPDVFYALSHEANLRVSQVYAIEGACYVLAATTMLGPAGLELFSQGDSQHVHGLCGGRGGTWRYSPRTAAVRTAAAARTGRVGARRHRSQPVAARAVVAGPHWPLPTRRRHPTACQHRATPPGCPHGPSSDDGRNQERRHLHPR